jgi:hypothetical protein
MMSRRVHLLPATVTSNKTPAPTKSSGIIEVSELVSALDTAVPGIPAVDATVPYGPV